MKNTLAAMALIAIAFSVPFAVALYGVAASERAGSSIIADKDSGYVYDYPTNLWEDY
jgi:hypothetical protein